MKDKYYTPEIEEFHVGFECEVVQEAQWVGVEVHQADMSYYERRLNTGSLRVKHLDKEDIESLGWEKKEKLYKKIGVFNGIGDFFTKKIYCKRDQTEKMVILFYNKRYNHILIYDEENKANRFVGTIKNKSELINQLKRCGI